MNVYQILTLIIITTFYLTYFIKQISLKTIGLKANRLIKGNKPQRTFVTELFLVIMTFSMAVLQYANIFFPQYFPLIFSSDVLKIIGIVFSFLGLILFMWAMVAMDSNWRAGVDNTQNTDMVTTGIYRLSRNPAFLGFDFIYIGTALTFFNFVTLLFTIAAIIVFHFQILEEEKYLPTVFGERYESYKKITGRYFPFF